MTGPFQTEAEVSALPAVRAVYAAFDRNPVVGGMQPHNYQMLAAALAVAGVELGAYDDRILRWLAGWEPATCAVIAGLISRANLPAESGAEPRRTAARAVLARFDDEVTAYSTGAVDNVPEPDWRSWAWHLAAQLRTLLLVTGEQAATLEVARDALLDEPQPTPGNGRVTRINPLPGSHVRVDGVAEIVPEDVATLLDALEVAADYKRDRAETCPDCDGAPAGSPDICGTCESRLHLAGLYDQLAERLGGGS
jgi:hypothetical protein